MATETPAEKAARFRKIAEDKSLPQEVRNTYLDKANALEKEAAKPTMAKGGAVPKKMMYGGMPYAKGGMAAAKTPAKGNMKKPSIAIMIAVGKPKEKMAKGGAVKPMAKKGGK
jgi:hypothetical protein